MLNSGTRPPIGVKLSCMLLTAPQLASVVNVANRAELAIPKRVSLPSMLPPDCARGGRSLNPQVGQNGIAGLLEVVADEHADQEHDGERRKNRPALPRVSDHLSEGVGQARRDHEDQEHRQQVAQRSRILKRMRGVRVEEAAAVGAQLLDGFLRRHRPLRDGLCLAPSTVVTSV